MPIVHSLKLLNGSTVKVHEPQGPRHRGKGAGSHYAEVIECEQGLRVTYTDGMRQAMYPWTAVVEWFIDRRPV